MEELSKEINALLHLIDDPDELVFQQVSERFIKYGERVIPILDEFQESVEEPLTRIRVTQIIDSISINGLTIALESWKEHEDAGVTEAGVIISKFIDREFNRDQLLFELEKIRKSIWLELNDYLTPLEVINVFNKIIFDHFKFRTSAPDSNKRDHFSLSQMIAFKEGGSYPIAAIYLIMSEMLGLEIRPADVYKQNLLCYREDVDMGNGFGSAQILFFFDPCSGQIFTHKDIENYYKKIGYHTPPEGITIAENSHFLGRWLQEYAKTLEKGSWMQLQIRDIAGSLY